MTILERSVFSLKYPVYFSRVLLKSELELNLGFRGVQKKGLKKRQPIYQRRATRLTAKPRDDITGFASGGKKRGNRDAMAGDRTAEGGERKSPLALKGVNVSRLNLKC